MASVANKQEKLYYLAYKKCKGDKKDAPASVLFTHDGERIEIPFGKSSARPYPKTLAQALVAKQRFWSKEHPAIVELEEAKATESDVEASKLKEAHEKEVADLKAQLEAAKGKK